MSNTTDQTDEPTAKQQSHIPLSRETLHFLFYFAVLVWVLLLLYWTQDWGRSDRLFPRLVGVPFVILLILQMIRIRYLDEYNAVVNTLIRTVTRSSKADEEGGDDIASELEEKLEQSKQAAGERSMQERQRYEVYMIGWIVLLPFMLIYLGFVNTVPVYMFAFLLFFTRDLKRSAILTVAFCAGLYVLFGVILNISLWPGQLGLPNVLDYV